MHLRGMGQTIDTNHITYVSRLLRQAAPTMSGQDDKKLFNQAAEALENRAATMTYGVPANCGSKIDISC
jgi:hypothetical protein